MEEWVIVSRTGQKPYASPKNSVELQSSVGKIVAVGSKLCSLFLIMILNYFAFILLIVWFRPDLLMCKIWNFNKFKFYKKFDITFLVNGKICAAIHTQKGGKQVHF